MTETRAPVFVAICLITTLLAFFVVAVRIENRSARGALMATDYVIMIAMAFSLVHFGLDMTLVASFGYGRHESDLPPNLQNSYKTKIIYWFIQIVTKLILLFAKLSLCLLYRKLLDRAGSTIVRISRALNNITLALVVCFYAAITFVNIFGCVPIRKNWYPEVPGRCVNNLITVNYVTSSVNIVTSFLLIYIPLPVLLTMKHLKVEVKQLVILILLGFIETLVSIVRAWSISLFWNLNTDFTWIVVPTHTIIVTEYNITIIAASLIVMRPCFHAFHDFSFLKSKQSTNGSTGYSIDRFPSCTANVQASATPRSHVIHIRDNAIPKEVDLETNICSLAMEDVMKGYDCF